MAMSSNSDSTYRTGDQPLWLVCCDKVIASATVAKTHRARLVGLITKQKVDGAMVFPKTRAVHTIGMTEPIDVAFCDQDMTVVDLVHGMKPMRFGRPRTKARIVVEAESGLFSRTGVSVGDRLELRS